MPASNNISEHIRAFLSENFMIHADEASLSATASLTQQGVIDSMGVLELILFIEQQFGFTIPDEDTLPENLDSIDRIERYVKARQGQTAVA